MQTPASTSIAWPFDQARNTATFTVRSIMDGSKPILRVKHDLDDHGWQFLSGEIIRMENALLVGLGEVVSRDSSLYELADLPPGWEATRENIHESWTRALTPPEDA